jgi:phosphomannomutase
MMTSRFFSSIGVKFQLINSSIGERFPHPPEPTPDNLGDLSKAVKEMQADIGLAFDPDSDRLAIVSEKGVPLGEEYTLALGCRYILKHKKGPMVVNVSSSMMNDFVAHEAGTKIYRTKVGERNVTEKLIGIKGVIGGEGNGGLIYPALHWGRDAFLGAAVILQYLASSEKSIGQIAGELPGYIMLKSKMTATRQDVSRKAGRIKRLFPKARIDEVDGIKILGDNWWVQLRASNTEPIARLTAEAPSETEAKKLVSAVKSVFK